MSVPLSELHRLHVRSAIIINRKELTEKPQEPTLLPCGLVQPHKACLSQRQEVLSLYLTTDKQRSCLGDALFMALGNALLSLSSWNRHQYIEC